MLDFRDETPRVPAILHYGKTDPSIPPENYEAVIAAQPNSAPTASSATPLAT